MSRTHVTIGPPDPVASSGRALPPLRRRLRAQHRRPRGFLGRGCARPRLGRRAASRTRPPRAPARALVPRRPAQHVSQRARSPRRRRTRRSARPDLRQPGHGDTADVHLQRAARRGRPPGGRAAGPGRRARRPRHPLPADGAAGADGDARVRAPGRDPLRRVRRLRGTRAGRAHRRRSPARRRLGLLRARGCAHDRVQAAARRRAGRGRARPAALRDPAAPPARPPP